MSETVSATDLEIFPLFEGLSEDSLASLAMRFSREHVPADEVIISAGDEGHSVYFLLEGQIRVLNHTLLGDEFALGQMDAGSYFGELSAIDGGGRSAEVEAVTDCQLLTVSPEEFRGMLMEHPDVMFRVTQNLALALRRTNWNALSHATL